MTEQRQTENASPSEQEPAVYGKVDFQFKLDPEYRLAPVTGVLGGVTPGRDSIMVDFYFERQALPQQVTHAITPTGVLGDEIQRIPSGHIMTRNVLFGVVLTAEVAEDMAAWLKKTAHEIKKRKT